MASLFDELEAKIQKDPSLRKRSVPRFDLSLLLFNARAHLRALWLAADAEVARATAEGRAPPEGLAAAVDALRPIFGPRPPPRV